MIETNSGNVVQTMLHSAFTRSDQDKNGALDKTEFKAMYEMLLTGTPVDKDGQPEMSLDDHFQHMDRNRDGRVTQSEMDSTPVAIPASVCDESLSSMIQFLLKKGTESSIEAAQLLSKTPTA